MINLISGKFKNTSLITSKYFNKNFKPTPFFIRKKIFNWFNIKKYYCLDLFSGSGALGFEAASRGCKLSLMFEKNRNIFFFLKKNMKSLKIKNVIIYNCSFFDYLNFKKVIHFYDLIFIDSPYIFLNNLFKYLNISLKYSKKGTYIYLETIFDLNLIMKNFVNKIKVVRNDFFKKINFFLFKVM